MKDLILIYKMGKNKIHLIEEVNNQYVFTYDEDNNKYLVFDKIEKITKKLKVSYDSKRNLEYIRYFYPKQKTKIRKYYHKSIYEIKFKLFGIIERGSGSQLKLNEADCIRIIKQKYTELGYLVGYTEMIQSEDPYLIKVYIWISKNGGAQKYIELTQKIGINNELHYRDHKGKMLKSSFEFIFFSILHFNKIEYEYESFKVGNFVPDFYIPSKKYLIEILGMNSRSNYSSKSKIKEKLYKELYYTYFPLNVNRHNINNSIIEGSKLIFGNKIKIPNFTEYFRKYTINGDEFIFELKKILKLVNNGEIEINDTKNINGIKQKYNEYYRYIDDKYHSILICISELIGVPSMKVKTNRVAKYWDNIDCTKRELENVFKKERHLPTLKEANEGRIYELYRLNQFYKHWGESSVKRGGKFYNFILELKKKYKIIQ